MAMNVSVGNRKITITESDQREADEPTGAPGAGLAQHLKQTYRDAARKFKDGAKAAKAAMASGVSYGSGVSARTTTLNGKTHVVVTKGTKTLERDYDQAVQVSVTGQDPSIVTVSALNGQVIEKTDF